ncbi:MAG: hypothetical protein KDE47_33665 [Caldilineaceae bacterium]|nr:hypothetical protein [Caldilineaceae bacterium]
MVVFVVVFEVALLAVDFFAVDLVEAVRFLAVLARVELALLRLLALLVLVRFLDAVRFLAVEVDALFLRGVLLLDVLLRAVLLPVVLLRGVRFWAGFFRLDKDVLIALDSSDMPFPYQHTTYAVFA